MRLSLCWCSASALNSVVDVRSLSSGLARMYVAPSIHHDAAVVVLSRDALVYSLRTYPADTYLERAKHAPAK